MSNDGKHEAGTGAQSPLLFQLGPVQDFIAQARSTRDMWSGSYLLSWLMAHAIVAVLEKGAETVIPAPGPDSNPLVAALRDPGRLADPSRALISNLPNRCLLLAPSGREAEIAAAAERAVRAELGQMGEAVWHWLLGKGADPAWKARWDAQIAAFPQMTWAWTPWAPGEPWREACGRVGALLAARRNTRDFAQWASAEAGVRKDSLSGKEEVVGTEAFWAKLRQGGRSLFKTSGHAYGAMNLIKRLWVHVNDADDADYLSSALHALEGNVRDALRVASLPEIAGRNEPGNNRYVAMLALNGDRMGERVSQANTSPEALSRFSARLSSFALDTVRGIVEGHHGELVHAGGDDVLAILPSTTAIACGRALVAAFSDVMGGGATASCGIAVGHEQAPLQMLVREARRMESVAKNRYHRDALAIALYKRSGEIIEWGCKWGCGALDLMAEITALVGDGSLSGRFPCALAGLLAPYALQGSNDAMKPVIQADVRHVLGRQGIAMNSDERERLAKKIDAYLETTSSRLDDFIKLFLVETFINRARGEN
ncbi:MAG: type III-B CRISPR-associated protein Cas10/Cmr2 [Kiritimatiellia bacterium]|jgi:CRISPR-associated protein Cmr2